MKEAPAAEFACPCGSRECFVEPDLNPLFQWIVFLLRRPYRHRTVCARCLRRFPGILRPNANWHKQAKV